MNLPPGFALREHSPFSAVADSSASLPDDVLWNDWDGLPAAEGARGRAPLRLLRLPDGSEALVRSARRGGALRGMRSGLFRSTERFFRELTASARLHAAGVPTPRILAVKFERVGEKFRAWTAMERVEGAEPLPARLARVPAEGDSWMDRAALLLWRMHEEGVVHADSHAGNFLAAGGELFVSDLDDAELRLPAPPDVARARNLLRFARSLAKLRMRNPAMHARWEAALFVRYAALMRTEPFRRLAGRAYAWHRLMTPFRRLRWRLSG
jgi:tRNA A-37 threonylcarbamoyl transferase component Bud32